MDEDSGFGLALSGVLRESGSESREGMQIVSISVVDRLGTFSVKYPGGPT